MKISIIIPVKNRASLITKTLDNILAQSLKPYQVIVVDDNSTDNLEEVLQPYKSQILFVKSEGRGPGAARNTGIKIASGEAIQFFDSDDLMTTDKLEVQAKLLLDNSADFVYGPFVKALEENGDWKRLDVIMQYYPLPKKNLSDLVLEGWCILTQSALFNREFINRVGPWRTDLIPHEDREYWFRIAELAKNYRHENQACVIYRQHGNQITDKAVANSAKTLDNIASTDIINKNRSNSNSLHSLAMFFGQRGYTKKYYNKTFSNQNHLNLGIKEAVASYYYALVSKVERKITGTGWMRMYGALDSDSVFEEYLRKLK